MPTYEDSKTLIEKIVAIKVQRWSFPGYNEDDIAQEVRIICWQALEKYDISKEGKGMFYFLAKCVDNGLFNKGRGIYFDNNPPCVRCPDYDRVTKECCGSQRYIDYQKRMARRRAIDNPTSLSSDDPQSDCFVGNTTVPSETGLINLDEYIRAHLDEHLIPAYEAISSGDVTSVPIALRRRIREQLEDIIE